MHFNRRSFIKTTTGAALAASLPLDSFTFIQSSQANIRKPIVVVLSEPSFPAGEISLPEHTILSSQLTDFEVRFITAQQLKEQLLTTPVDVFINPYGSQFPKESWGTLFKYLKAGGNWLNLGGVPFSVPVVKKGNEWQKEIPQVAYHKKLGITQSFPVETKELKIEGAIAKEIQLEQVYELYCRFTETRDFPNEDGPAGARDASIHAIAYCLSDENRKIAASIIQIDRMQGDYAGGRWILANFKGKITPGGIRKLIERTVQSSSSLTVRTSFACYNAGEVPSLTIQFRKPKGNVENILVQDCVIEILNENKKVIEQSKIRLEGKGSVATGYLNLKKQSLAPGLYMVTATQQYRLQNTTLNGSITHTTGFWIFDKKLLEGGKPFTTNETYLLRDNEPYPVTGTSYMGSDVHRKFLFEPNPFLWNNDFAEMKSAGINMVRTGIWTAWKNYMLDVGVSNEVALRALDAFLLTARKYDIPVIFTFFAFLPEMWGGENPYLDPRSVNAQKEFITAFSHRYKNVNDIIWDFINEPSFCNPQQLWTCRPNYDKYEMEAWVNWLKKKYPAETDEQFTSNLSRLYRCLPDEALSLPKLEEFADANIFNESCPVKVIDYRLFAQEMFVEWTREMTKAIRSNDNPLQLITVGQDEGGTYERPGPHFYNEAVDFTCLHNWWYNGDLLWDSIMTKAPGKPSLVEETGVMFYEKMDGSAWRTEQEVARLLERKLALSFAAGGAGFIEWIWNTNPYMKSDNEAAIGLHRVDGTSKPEFDCVTTYAKFFNKNKHLMTGRVDENVVMVIPHSQMFSTRNFATEATQKCVRAMLYHCRVPARAVSEYKLHTLKTQPKLFIVPSPRTLHERAWSTLMQYAEEGATILISGIIDTDDHWLPVERARQLGFKASIRPINQTEFLKIGETDIQIRFNGEKLQRIEKAVIDTDSEIIVQIKKGLGAILWSPLPVELSEGVEATIAYYKFALKLTGISEAVATETQDTSILILPTFFSDSILYTLISESDRDSEITIKQHNGNNQLRLHVLAQQTSLYVVRRSDGTIISQLPNN
ncbi:MAG: hypothetical protein EPO24_00710 [Bacteroidetes bacterium]|nr:MAG: hypothetical protein EPO24_00710 [Bacteroidota bacterium]